MSKYQLSKWFARGAGHVVRYQNSETLLFSWNGKADGARVYVSAQWAERAAERQTVRVVEASAKTLRRSPSAWRFAELGVRV